MGFKALLVGINAYKRMPLRGCVNDVENIRDVLTDTYNLSSDNLRTLLDADATRANIEAGLRWLAEPDGSATPQVRLFHFSGHGISIADRNGDEPDGRDEALAQYDFDDKAVGPMTDDVLRELYNQFPDDMHLLLTMDCCHSGDISFPAGMDVRYRVLEPDPEEYQLMEQAQREFRLKRAAMERELRDAGVSAAEREEKLYRFDHKQRFGEEDSNDKIVMLAACRADQLAADARFEGRFNGAFSYFLSQVLREAEQVPTYEALIEAMLERLEAKRFDQTPQIMSSSANVQRPFLNSAG